MNTILLLAALLSAPTNGPFYDGAVNSGLPLSGGTLTGPLLLPNGSLADPSLEWSNSAGSGFSKGVGNRLTVGINATPVMSWTAVETEMNKQINAGTYHLYSSSQLLELGGNMTTTHALGTGDVGVAGDLEVDGNLWSDGGARFLSEVPTLTPSSFDDTYTLVGRSALTGASSGSIFMGYHVASNSAVIGSLSPGVAWRPLQMSTSEWSVADGGGNKEITIDNDGFMLHGQGTTSSHSLGGISGDAVFGGSLEVDGTLFNDSGIMHFAETTTPTAVSGSGALYTKTDNVLYFQDGAGDEHAIGGDVPTFISFSHSTGASGVHWMGGFYDAPVAEAVLTQSATTQTHGTAASGARGAHAFFVSKQAGNVDAGSASVVVSGTSITDAGVRTTSDTETIIADITAESVNNYSETSKKWLGQVTYTITPAGAGTYDLSGNFGFNKYDDLGNRDFTVTDFECVFEGGATDTGLDIELLHHQSAAWTYHASAFVPGNGALASCATDYSTDCKVISGEFNAYKRSGLSTAITGANGEGFLIRLTTATNNSINSIDCRTGVQF